MNEVARMLKDLLGAHRITAKQVADELGVTTTTLSNWKRGFAVPRDRNIESFRELHARYMQGVDTLEGAARQSIDRDTAILRMYKRGDRLQEIGDIFGLSRERVRQIVAAKGG